MRKPRLREGNITARKSLAGLRDVRRPLTTILVHSKGSWAVGQRKDEVAGLVKEDLLYEVTQGWALGWGSASQAAGPPRVVS